MIGGAQLLTASYAAAYAGADGPILSRGAMAAAAIAKASSARPVVVGKPSRAALREYGRRLACPPAEVAVIGDDLRHGHRARPARRLPTVLVRTGISSDLDLAPARKRTARPAVSNVAELLQWL